MDWEGKAGKELAAFVVGKGGVSGEELRRWMGEVLPGAMVPGRVKGVERLPLTSNGKVDKAALREWAGQEEEGGREPEEAPRTREEKELAEVWEEVLGRKKVGRRENYFALGGDSIKAIRMGAKLRERGWRVEVREVFTHPTVEELAGCMRREGEKAKKQEEVKGEVELTPVQRWWAGKVEKEHWSHFNNAVLLKVEKVEVGALRRALEAVGRQHDALRLRWRQGEEAGVRQEYAQEGAARELGEGLVEVEVKGGEWRKELEREAEKLQGSLSLEKGPVARAGLIHTPEGERVLWVVHHVAVDAVSWGVLVEDLGAAYRQCEAGAEQVVLPEKTDSFQSWSRALRDYAGSAEVHADKSYWAGVDAEVKRLGPLPSEGARGTGVEGDVARLRVELDEERTSILLRVAGILGRLGMNGLLVTGLARAFHDWTGEPRLALAMEGHGRERIPGGLDVSRTVGWFTSIYPVVIDSRPAESTSEQLHSVLRSLRGAARRGLSYGLLRGDSSPLGAEPPMGFNYLGEETHGSDVSGGFVEADEATGSSRSPHARRLREIEIDVLVRDGRLQLQLAYNGRAFPESRMRRLAEGSVHEAVEVARSVSPRSVEAERVRLYLLPFAGGSVDAYGPLLAGLGREVDVVPVELPGRGARSAERSLESLGAMTEFVLERIRADGGGPYALFGHSLGALLAYEVARAASAAGLDAPRHVFCGGLGAPWRIPPREGPRSDSELLSGTNRPPPTPEARDRLLEVLRADIGAVDRYRHQPGCASNAPLTLLAGEQEGISDEDLLAWREAAPGGFTVRRFEGGHGFLFEHVARITELISETLSE
ncbi:alpha/beta fold hydrolase [Melittangium boletus]|uniref:alpha/beta fold hydrolase n=1 Tax=Melittangium boletus TaxID=83453 RepID=UPI001472C493|nr:alpha/beta fold hydrolase [Melittangium boletus]